MAQASVVIVLADKSTLRLGLDLVAADDETAERALSDYLDF